MLITLKGLYEKIWLSLTEADRKLLEGQNIHDGMLFFFSVNDKYFSICLCIIVQTAFSSRFTRGQVLTTRNQIAFRICNGINQEHSALKKLTDIKQSTGLGVIRMQLELAHPNLLVSDLHKFMENIKPSPDSSFRSVMEELETMEIWRDGKKERLFADSDSS
jgi:hypothetical protein